MSVNIYPSSIAPPSAGSVATDLATHEADTANPHSVTASQAGAVALATYDAHTILAATSDNTPAAVTIAEGRILGRLTGGNIAALTGAQVGGLIALGDLSDVGTATPTNGHVLQGNGTSWNNVALTTGDSDAIHDNVSGEVAALTQKTVPTAADHLLIEDAAASNAKKRIVVGDLPGAVLLMQVSEASGLAISQHTTASADRTTTLRSWNFVCDGVLFDGIWGSSGWKIVAYCRGKTQNALDEFKLSLYDVDGTAVIGSDTANVIGTSYVDFAVEWTTGLPSTRKTLNISYYNNPGSTGHLSYINSLQVYATRQ